VISLDQVHPAAILRVATDIQRETFGLTTGGGIRQCWESSRIQRIKPWSTLTVPEHLTPILCPDGSKILIKFHSELQLLGQEPPTQAVRKKVIMPSKPAPPKKPVPAKKLAPAVKPEGEVKPVAAPKAAKVRPPKPEKPPGNYKWMLHRYKSQVLSIVDDAQRSVIRDGLKIIDSGAEVKAFLVRSGISEERLDTFFWGTFIEATINRPDVK